MENQGEFQSQMPSQASGQVPMPASSNANGTIGATALADAGTITAVTNVAVAMASATSSGGGFSAVAKAVTTNGASSGTLDKNLSARVASMKLATDKTAALELPSVPEYMDFRKYLADYFSYRKEISKNDYRPYTYSVFSAAADIKSPNYLKMIIEGKRNLSPDMIAKFAKAMGLSKDDAEDFKLLVLYNQSSDPADRNVHLKRLTNLRVQNQLKSGEIDVKAWEKIPNWIAWILYAMLDQKDVSFTLESLRTMLRGKASVAEIQDSIDSLLKAGEVIRDEASGELRKAHNLIDQPDEVPVALVRKLQTQLMYLGLESLHQDAATDREFGTVTLAMTKEEFEQVKFQLRKMRKEIHRDNATKRQNSKGDRVYQLNIQLFPVTDAT